MHTDQGQFGRAGICHLLRSWATVLLFLVSTECAEFLSRGNLHLCKRLEYDIFILQPAGDYRLANKNDNINICGKLASKYRPMSLVETPDASCVDESFRNFGISEITGKPLVEETHGIYLHSQGMNANQELIPSIYSANSTSILNSISATGWKKRRVVCGLRTFLPESSGGSRRRLYVAHSPTGKLPGQSQQENPCGFGGELAPDRLLPNIYRHLQVLTQFLSLRIKNCRLISLTNGNIKSVSCSEARKAAALCQFRNDGHPDRWIAPSPQVSKLRFFALLKRNITNHHWIGWHRPEQDYGAYDAVMIKCHLSRRNGTVVYRSPLMWFPPVPDEYVGRPYAHVFTRQALLYIYCSSQVRYLDGNFGNISKAPLATQTNEMFGYLLAGQRFTGRCHGGQLTARGAVYHLAEFNGDQQFKATYSRSNRTGFDDTVRLLKPNITLNFPLVRRGTRALRFSRPGSITNFDEVTDNYSNFEFAKLDENEAYIRFHYTPSLNGTSFVCSTYYQFHKLFTVLNRENVMELSLGESAAFPQLCRIEGNMGSIVNKSRLVEQKRVTQGFHQGLVSDVERQLYIVDFQESSNNLTLFCYNYWFFGLAAVTHMVKFRLRDPPNPPILVNVSDINGATVVFALRPGQDNGAVPTAFKVVCTSPTTRSVNTVYPPSAVANVTHVTIHGLQHNHVYTCQAYTLSYKAQSGPTSHPPFTLKCNSPVCDLDECAMGLDTCPEHTCRNAFPGYVCVNKTSILASEALETKGSSLLWLYTLLATIFVLLLGGFLALLAKKSRHSRRIDPPLVSAVYAAGQSSVKSDYYASSARSVLSLSHPELAVKESGHEMLSVGHDFFYSNCDDMLNPSISGLEIPLSADHQSCREKNASCSTALSTGSDGARQLASYIPTCSPVKDRQDLSARVQSDQSFMTKSGDTVLGMTSSVNSMSEKSCLASKFAAASHQNQPAARMQAGQPFAVSSESAGVGRATSVNTTAEEVSQASNFMDVGGLRQLSARLRGLSRQSVKGRDSAVDIATSVNVTQTHNASQTESIYGEIPDDAGSVATNFAGPEDQRQLGATMQNLVQLSSAASSSFGSGVATFANPIFADICVPDSDITSSAPSGSTALHQETNPRTAVAMHNETVFSLLDEVTDDKDPMDAASSWSSIAKTPKASWMTKTMRRAKKTAATVVNNVLDVQPRPESDSSSRGWGGSSNEETSTMSMEFSSATVRRIRLMKDRSNGVVAQSTSGEVIPLEVFPIESDADGAGFFVTDSGLPVLIVAAFGSEYSKELCSVVSLDGSKYYLIDNKDGEVLSTITSEQAIYNVKAAAKMRILKDPAGRSAFRSADATLVPLRVFDMMQAEEFAEGRFDVVSAGDGTYALVDNFNMEVVSRIVSKDGMQSRSATATRHRVLQSSRSTPAKQAAALEINDIPESNYDFCDPAELSTLARFARVKIAQQVKHIDEDPYMMVESLMTGPKDAKLCMQASDFSDKGGTVSKTLNI